MEKSGIEVVFALLGIGENYQDHHFITYPYYTSLNEYETLDGLFSGHQNATEAIQKIASILGWNAQDVTSKLRPTDSEVAELGPVFHETWDREYRNNPIKPLLCTALVGL